MDENSISRGSLDDTSIEFFVGIIGAIASSIASDIADPSGQEIAFVITQTKRGT